MRDEIFSILGCVGTLNFFLQIYASGFDKPDYSPVLSGLILHNSLVSAVFALILQSLESRISTPVLWKTIFPGPEFPTRQLSLSSRFSVRPTRFSSDLPRQLVHNVIP